MKKSLLAIVGICVLFAGINLLFLLHNGAGSDDSHWNVENGINFYYYINQIMEKDLTLVDKAGEILGLLKSGAIIPQDNWPVLLYFTTFLMLKLFGKSLIVLVLMTNVFYLFILMLSVFFICKKIKDIETGLFAAISVALMPAFFMVSRDYALDFPVTAMVSLGVMFLIYSDGFKLVVPSIMFGVVSGLGLLTKGQYVFFIAGPLLYTIFSNCPTFLT